MSMRRIITLPLPAAANDRHLTAELVEVLRVVSEQYRKPVIRKVSEGIAIYVDDWSGKA